MTHFWSSLAWRGRLYRLEDLYQGPTDPVFLRDISRLEDMMAASGEMLVGGMKPLTTRQALSVRLLVWLQLWMATHVSARPQLKSSAEQALRRLTTCRGKIEAQIRLFLHHFDTPQDWCDSVKRHLGEGDAMDGEDIADGWMTRLEIETQLSEVAAMSMVGGPSDGLRAADRAGRETTADLMSQAMIRGLPDVDVVFRRRAKRAVQTHLSSSQLDASSMARDAALDVAKKRAPELVAAWIEGSLEQKHCWHDRYAVTTPTPVLSRQEAHARTMAALAYLHPDIARSARLIRRRGWLKTPQGRGGGYTLPVMFDNQDRCLTGPHVQAPFDGTITGLQTLAHELGHGVHAWLARAQGIWFADAGWAVCEAMALSAEIMSIRHDREQFKRQILTMLVHQPALALFEQNLSCAADDQPVDAIWLDSMRTIYGSQIDFAGYEAFWRRHTMMLTNADYARAYVLGWALAQYGVRQCDEAGPRAQQTYMEVMQAGGRIGFDQACVMFGVDDVEDLLNDAYDQALTVMRSDKRRETS